MTTTTEEKSDVALKCDILNCKKCPLSENKQIPLAPLGTGRGQVMFITDSPGKDEYKAKTPIVAGEGWILLRNFMKSAGFTKEEVQSYVYTNAIKCHIPTVDYKNFQGNTPTQVVDCGDWLDKEIAEYKPKLIVAFGSIVIYRFSNDYYNGVVPKKRELSGISEKHGQIEWSEKYQCHIMYLFSPRYVVKNPSRQSIFVDAIHKMRSFITNDFQELNKSVTKEYQLIYAKPSADEEEHARNRADYIDRAIAFLKGLQSHPSWSVDLETTGLDHFIDDIEIISFSWAKGKAAAIEWSMEIMPYVAEALENRNCSKTFSNGKFDFGFIVLKYGMKLASYDFDTQIAAHLIDENSRVGLEPISSRYLGVDSYKDQFWKKKAEFDKKEDKTIEDVIAFKESFLFYACDDADNSQQLRVYFEPRLLNPEGLAVPPPANRNPYWVLRNISMPLTKILPRMEANGIKFNEAYMELLETKLKKDLEETYTEAGGILYEALFPDLRAEINNSYERFVEVWGTVHKFFTENPGPYKSKPLEERVAEFPAQVEAFMAALEDLRESVYTKEEIQEKLHDAAKMLYDTNVIDGKVKRSGIRVSLQSIKTGFSKTTELIAPLADAIGQIDAALIWFEKIYDFKFNMNSPVEMSHYLFNIFKFPVLAHTKSGGPATDKATIDELYNKVKHPFLKLLVKAREIDHDLSNYIDAIRKAIHPFDGRVHPSFSQTRTVTGRLGCGDPAMHGIKRLFEIRNMVVPEKGHFLIEGDLSQAEIRFLAEMSQDLNLIDAFKAGGDIHEENARRIFKTPEGQKPTKEQRAATKRIVFAILYGAAVASIAESLGISVQEAQEYFDKFYAVYPRTKEWMAEMLAFCRQHGFVVNHYGRIRRLPGIKSSQKSQVRECERQTINAPIQGSATGDYAALVHIRLQEWLDEEFPNGEVRQIHNHHDAILVEAPFHLARYVQQKVKYIAEHADPNLTVPIVFDCDVVACWSGSPMTDEDMERYIKDQAEGTAPTHGYCQFVKDDETVCNNLYLPFADYNICCPDHWGTYKKQQAKKQESEVA